MNVGIADEIREILTTWKAVANDAIIKSNFSHNNNGMRKSVCGKLLQALELLAYK